MEEGEDNNILVQNLLSQNDELPTPLKCEVMGKLKMEERIASLGYFLLPSTTANSPGYPGLLVAIRAEPTGEHYDPEVLHVHLRTTDGLARWCDLARQPLLHAPEQVVLGRLSLRDRVDKRVDFFTFGGCLDITTTAKETIYTLTSPAPILELTGRRDEISDQLTTEVEALMAGYLARWGRNNDGLVRCLVQQEPLVLYVACLKSLYRQYQQVSLFRQEYPQFYTMLRSERERLANENAWTHIQPDLEALLRPC
jgi:hypothetical protein